jgi:uncharacterized phage-associated protein
MPHLTSSRDVADYLLNECRERGEVLTNLKLQKLIYYAQAWFLGLHGRQMFEEDCEAWVHGPVVPSQYHRFSDYRWQPITGDVAHPDLPADIQKHLDKIIDMFGAGSAITLELMTHRELPWIEARGDLPPNMPSNNPISKYTMRDFYRAMSSD